MEALLLVLFYALSWYLKNRQQKSAHKQIESDPEWDPKNDKEDSLTEPSWIEQFIESTNDSLKETLLSDFETENNSFEYQDEGDYEEPIYDLEPKAQQDPKPKIKEEKTLPSRSAYNKNKYSKIGVFTNALKRPGYIRNAIILKEILDKPVALRKRGS
ncbi:MAG: hypothetical protein CMG67_00315 [Candidatus Marinimicrobia bacterium]|nr:hypothetical protein [Candidatus Neomarinimicrobiota bacterium]|tara:strand:+ start:576 stop:1049 length:474 start_codon:yes stop_codon:yes gene_type:complete